MEAPRPTPRLDERRCPLCGDDNRCAPAAAGRFDVPCWCTEADIPARLLAAIPEAARGKACICARCVAAARRE